LSHVRNGELQRGEKRRNGRDRLPISNQRGTRYKEGGKNPFHVRREERGICGMRGLTSGLESKRRS